MHPRAEMQERAMQIQLRPDPAQMSAGVPVVKRDFVPQITLMAPPIIFSTRLRPSAECDTRYSSNFVENMSFKALQHHCGAPSKCQSSLLRDNTSASVLSCAGPQQDEAMFFGLDAVTFLSSFSPDRSSGAKEVSGFADFLYAITDQDFVLRRDGQDNDGDGKYIPTSSFIDSNTQAVKIVLIFFTPRQGLTSILTISADTSSSRNARVWFEVKHFEILEGARLRTYIGVQSLVVLSISIMFFSCWRVLSRAFKQWRLDGGIYNRTFAIEALTDLVYGGMVLCYIPLSISSMIDSAKNTRDILGRLESIPWSSPLVSPYEKKRIFLDTVSTLQSKIEDNESHNTICNVILLVNLLRVIMCTTVHPRLALLTGTLSHAVSHRLYISCVCMCVCVCVCVCVCSTEHVDTA